MTLTVALMSRDRAARWLAATVDDHLPGHASPRALITDVDYRRRMVTALRGRLDQGSTTRRVVEDVAVLLDERQDIPLPNVVEVCNNCHTVIDPAGGPFGLHDRVQCPTCDRVFHDEAEYDAHWDDAHRQHSAA